MSINLSKGQKIEVNPNNLTIGLGWTPNSGTNGTFDLDCSIFMLDTNKMIPTQEHFIFYNNAISPDKSVKHSGDDRTGENSANGDDEQISINTSLIDNNIHELLFVVTINDAQSKNQNFGMIRGSYIRIVDNTTNTEIAKYELDEDFSIETAIEFGRLYKRDDKWKFDASGIGYKEDLSYFVSKYYAGPVSK